MIIVFELLISPFYLAYFQTPPEDVKPLYLQYAKLEEQHGLAKRAMQVYNQAVKAVPAKEKLEMYEIYIARASEIFGVPKTREIYEVRFTLPVAQTILCISYSDAMLNLLTKRGFQVIDMVAVHKLFLKIDLIFFVCLQESLFFARMMMPYLPLM